MFIIIFDLSSLNYFSFKPNYLSKLSPKQDKELVFGSMSNSPTVLTERFSELFENQWSVAFTELSKVIGGKAAVRHLLWIVAVCMSCDTLIKPVIRRTR